MTITLPANAGVLVTRPKDQAAELIEAIESAGGRALVLPALAIAALPHGPIAEGWSLLPTPDIVVFVSPNAVRHGLNAIDLPKDAHIAAIGPATRRALMMAGYSVTISNPAGADSEHLLAANALSHDIAGKTVTIIRGNGGRELLGKTLRERGAEVGYLSVYERKCPPLGDAERDELLAQWRAGAISALTCLSEATFDNLRSLLGDEGVALLNATPLVSPSRRLIERLEASNFHSVAALAPGPEPAAMVATIAELLNDNDNGATMSESDREPEEDTADDTQPSATEEVPGEAEPAVALEVPAALQEPSALNDTGDDASLGTDTPQTPEAPELAAPPMPKRSRLAGLVSGAALLLSLLALGVSAWLYRQSLEVDTSAEDAMAQRLATADTRVDEIDTYARTTRKELDESDASRRELAGELGKLSASVGRSQDIVESLPGRVQNVEKSLSDMQGIAAGTRDTWLIAEAEYYMQLANAQLQLARNPVLASYGLELADERIRELASPVYTPVRRALAEEIQALKALERQDEEGISLRLAGIARVVDEMPLLNEVVVPEDSADGGIGEQPAGAKRALAAVKNIFRDTVRVRRSDENLTPLMSPEATYFLRTNLELKLDTARLALLRGEQSAYEQSLDDAASWISEYFDMDSDAVRQTLATIADIRDRELGAQFPDITRSLVLLRQLAALRETDPQ